MKNNRSILAGRVHRYAWLTAVVWTLAIAASFLWDLRQEQANFEEAALGEALAYLNKDEAFRLWATSHERVYVPVTDHSPNPFMADVVDRDIVTPSGLRLTLISHIQMTREINRDYARLFGATGHLTSLRLKSPEDRPDTWEQVALEQFEGGESIRTMFTEAGGRPALRVMRPVVMGESCMPCHGGQGYSLGQIRGGISLELPLDDRLRRRNRMFLTIAVTHVLLWIFGLVLLRLGDRKLADGIAQRDRFEAALKKSEERFRRISEAITDYTFTVTVRDGLAVRMDHSPACVAVTGYTSDEFAKTPSLWLDIIHPDDRDAVLDYTDQLLSGVKARPVEYRIRHRDGAFRTVVNHPLLHVDDKGRLTAYEGLVRDITEQKRMEQRLFQSQKMQSIATLAGGIAHDFNNMMTGVLGYAELLRAKVLNDPKSSRMLQHIATSARRAGDLSQQLLAYARGGKYQPTPLVLNDVVRETLDLQRHAFPPAIALGVDLAEDLLPTRADPAQIQQVVMNLCLNAAEAMGNRGRLEITTRNRMIEAAGNAGLDDPAPGPHVMLRIRDDGPGMSAEVAGKIFEPFFSTKAQGRGLGLAAVYGIVRNHNGTIRVESAPGTGSCFELLLPAAQEAAAAEVRGEPGEPEGTETILIVDDDASVRAVTSTFLEDKGYRVLAAPGGAEALRTLRAFAGTVHVTLLDMGLPGMTGPEIFVAIGRERPGMKFVIISGYDPDEDIRDLLDRGAQAFLQKPYASRELLAVVRRILDAR